MIDLPEPATTLELPNITVFSSGRIAAPETDLISRAIGRVLNHRGVAAGARIRLTTGRCRNAPMLVQVNLQVGDTPTRVQTIVDGRVDLPSALMRLDQQIRRARGPWRPRPWPDRGRRMLTAPSDSVITRRKTFELQVIPPMQAVAAMDVLDYDVHLFIDAESGEDAVVYRAGPSGIRLARQRHVYPPGWSWASSRRSDPPVPLIVNSTPPPALTETDAARRMCEHRLRMLFYTDPVSGRGRLLYPRYDGNLGLIASGDNCGLGEV